MNTEDRRAPGATRLPFDGLVEVGGALGPSFEAQAVNVSEDGMHLRTAYLPEQGQPLTCRFDAGPGQSVLVSGEVVWSQGAEKGGEFGVRFTDMDAESVDSLKRVCGVTAATEAPAVQAGSKVRLHIDGLASPMRAKIRDARATAVTVGSDLGFLQVGRQLELEDAQSGKKRPASIDRVEVAVDPTSQVPQLIVTLRYSDMHAPVPTERRPCRSRMGAASEPRLLGRRPRGRRRGLRQMKGALARNLTRVGPAVERLAERAKTMVALLAKRARRSLAGAADDGAGPGRRAARDRATRRARRRREPWRPRRERRGGAQDGHDEAQGHHRGRRHARGRRRRDRHQEIPSRRGRGRRACGVGGPRRPTSAPPGSAAPATAPPEPTGALSHASGRRAAAVGRRRLRDGARPHKKHLHVAALRQRTRAPRQRPSPQDGRGRSNRSRARSSRRASP